MHFANRFLSRFGFQVSRIGYGSGKLTDQELKYREDYERYFRVAEKNERGFFTTKAYRYEAGNHPLRFQDLEFEFAAYHLHKAKPRTILDIGSHREFILGLLAHYDVTSVDIRKRNTFLDNGRFVTCDAKELVFDNDSFDTVLSLEALPHFGLCRYGDKFDLDADIKAFHEMLRVLRPGGLLIFSTAVTGAHPSIAFNARRNYSHEMIRDLCRDLTCVEERFIDRLRTKFCSVNELTTDPDFFDYYVGCWQKKVE